MLIRNAAATLAGQLVYPVTALALVPFYISRLGLEAYGLIGLMALVVSLLSVFSRGLGGALQREVSGRLASGAALTLRRLLRSTEVFYWLAAVLFGALLAAGAVAGAARWVETDTLGSDTVTVCLVLLALRVALGFPHSVYQSVLIGADRQVLGSALNASLALGSAASGVAAVILFGSVTAVFASEALVAGAFFFVYRFYAYRVLPVAAAPFVVSEFRGLAGISLALMWTSGAGLLLGMMDRLFVGALLPVAALGVYTIATMGGRIITLVSNPVLQSVYPEMCRTARSGTADDQARNVLRNLSLLLVITAAIAVPACAFSREILQLWVADADVAVTGAPVLSAYMAGNALTALGAVFYQWQTAAGRTSTAVRFSASALVWLPVTIAVLISYAGLVGAALAWTIYGVLAWITTLVTTFRAGALPVRYLAVTVRLVALALLPSVGLTLGARALAGQWFPHVLAGRVSLAAIAAGAGAIAAFIAVRPHLPLRVAPAVAQPVFQGIRPE